MTPEQPLDRFSEEIEAVIRAVDFEISGDEFLSDVDRCLSELYAGRADYDQLREVVRAELLIASVKYFQDKLPTREEFERQMTEEAEERRRFFKKMQESQSLSRARLDIVFGRVKTKA